MKKKEIMKRGLKEIGQQKKAHQDPGLQMSTFDEEEMEISGLNFKVELDTQV